MEAKINKSRLMKRAWYLVREKGYSLSCAMIKVWKEAKEYVAEKANEVKAAIEKAKLQTWWSTPEYKALREKSNNSYKKFAADK